MNITIIITAPAQGVSSNVRAQYHQRFLTISLFHSTININAVKSSQLAILQEKERRIIPYQKDSSGVTSHTLAVP